MNMTETLSVSLSGPAFSFLLYENTKSTFGQEGFLLGDIVEKETKTITDNDQQQVHISRVIKINSAVPCPHIHFFYDGIGRLDTEKIKNFLGDSTSKVVAWYKYRASSSFNFTFRERIVHSQLGNFFEVAPDYFTCCLLISESSDNGSTHSFTQNFVRYRNHIYEQLPLHIVNLSDSNNTYKSPERVSETFSNILKGLKINHKKSQGLTTITKIQNALQKHTVNIVKELSEAEKKLFQLENEVNEIQETVKNKRLASASNDKENQLNDIIMMETNSEENALNDTVNNKHLASASNDKETHLNDVIMMDINSSELRPIGSPNSDSIPKKNVRGRGKATPTKSERRGSSNSPSKKTSAEIVRETRSRKKN